MKWQEIVYARLRDGEWHTMGELFDLIEMQLPLHFAMREVVRRQGKIREPERIVPNTHARWRYFITLCSQMRLEARGGASYGTRCTRSALTEVRFRYDKGKVCPQCGGPVIPRTVFSRHLVACVSCDWADQFVMGRRNGSAARLVEVEDERRIVDAG